MNATVLGFRNVAFIIRTFKLLFVTSFQEMGGVCMQSCCHSIDSKMQNTRIVFIPCAGM